MEVSTAAVVELLFAAKFSLAKGALRLPENFGRTIPMSG
jgi:hypothetical protein